MRSVFIVGNSLFAEGISQTLANSNTVEVVGTTSTVEEVLPLLETERPDAVIVADTGKASWATFDSLLAGYPDLPIIRADLSNDYVQIITSKRVGTRPSDLLAAIASLPRQHSDHDNGESSEHSKSSGINPINLEE